MSNTSGEGKKNFGNLVLNLVLAEGGGFLSSILANNISDKYSQFIQPSFAPPGFIFPIVWTILYALMAIANYLASENPKGNYLYFIQLLMNFLWPIFFFGLDMKFFSFIWLIFLTIVVIITTKEFYKASKISGTLMLPYIVWLIYAGYLNFGVWWLN